MLTTGGDVTAKERSPGREALLRSRLESFSPFVIEPELDRVSLTDPQAFAALLAEQLEA